MIIFEIEYEIPPFRAIHNNGISAKDEKDALEKFKKNNPEAIIRSVKVRQHYNA